jgi:hypothetical protein
MQDEGLCVVKTRQGEGLCVVKTRQEEFTTQIFSELSDRHTTFSHAKTLMARRIQPTFAIVWSRIVRLPPYF